MTGGIRDTDPIFTRSPVPLHIKDRRHTIPYGLLCFLFLLMASANASDSSAPTSSPAVVFIEEMQPWPSEYGPLTAGFLDPAIGEMVQVQWPEHIASITQHLTTEALIGISRWAKSEMATCTISLEQIASLSFGPEAQTTNREQVLYSQSIQDGIPLPSHHPLVFRRLLVAVAFDTATRRVSRIFITIRGWREE